MFVKHGMHRHPLYRRWIHMKERCYSPGHHNFEIYNGRGITVCDEWRHDFMAFYDHVSVLPNCGEPGYTLDRIDNNGNYEPGNVRWATAKEQHRNTRYNNVITFDGRTQCLQAWADEIGIHQRTLSARLKKGWTPEKALTTPLVPLSLRRWNHERNRV